MIIYSQFLAGDYIADISLCDDIITYFQSSPNKEPGQLNGGLDLESKDSTDLPLNTSPELAERYQEQLRGIISGYIKEYPWCDRYSPWGLVEGINIQHYAPGGGYYLWHCERSTCDSAFRFAAGSSRHLVFMTYLNDVTDAGETEWANQQLKIQPRKGLTVVWPVDWTFTHRGVPSLTQDKYIVTGWMNYIPEHLL